MSLVLIAVSVLAAVLLVLLAAATGNTSLFAGNYDVLIQLNVAVACVLGALVVWQMVSVFRARAAGRFGSRLTVRFLLLFALMALVPGTVVYSVSVGFLGRSIESWFDVRVESALEEGLNLGRAILDIMLNDLDAKARAAALDLADLPPARQPAALGRLREQAAVDEMLLIGATGVLSSVARTGTRIVPGLAPSAAVRQARLSRMYRAVESEPGGGLVLRVIRPVIPQSLSDEQRLVELIQRVPERIAQSAEAVQSVNRDYRELALSRVALRRTYVFALTLTLMLALLSAVVLAVILSRRLTAPLATLAEATAAVARGDFSRRAAVLSADEMGTLTRAFNSMTEQLATAYRAAEGNRLQEEKARAHLENILASLSSGVIVLDPQMQLVAVNAAASQILDHDLASLPGARLDRAPTVATFGCLVHDQFAKADQWQEQLELETSGKVLVLRGSLVSGGDRTDHLVVFDDVTALIQAQRATAWGEVAQRLAHEIKNPLTPILLATERLRVKFADRLSAPDAQALERAVDIILTQVNAMKSMVDEFRVYARLPRPSLEAVDLNRLVGDVLSLYEHARERIRFEPAVDLPPVLGDPRQLYQVVHNLLQNADDSVTARGEGDIVLSTARARAGVLLAIVDSGGGFPEGIIQRAFEPYVTTKPRGTGLGLAIVKKIIDEHHGSIELVNRPAGGAEVNIILPLAGIQSEGGG